MVNGTSLLGKELKALKTFLTFGKPANKITALFLAFATILVASCPVLAASESPWSGSWKGRLSDQFGGIEIVVHIQKTELEQKIKIDSPDQRVFDIVTSQAEITGENVIFEVGSESIRYEGKYFRDKNEIQGKFTQKGLTSDLILKPKMLQATLIPKELSFTFDSRIPKDFRGSEGSGECRIHLFNATPSFVALAMLNVSGNLVLEPANPKGSSGILLVSPGGRSDPAQPYVLPVGSAFAIFSPNRGVIGYGKVWQPGECELRID